MANTNFAEERGAPQIITETRIVSSTDKILKFRDAIQRTEYQPLSIPRRPAWNREMSKEELHEAENENFLKWRRDLAIMQES
jgi:large subunit GTPase 1